MTTKDITQKFAVYTLSMGPAGLNNSKVSNSSGSNVSGCSVSMLSVSNYIFWTLPGSILSDFGDVVSKVIKKTKKKLKTFFVQKMYIQELIEKKVNNKFQLFQLKKHFKSSKNARHSALFPSGTGIKDSTDKDNV